MSATNWQVWRDRDVARRFTEQRRGGLLGSAQQIDTMLRLLRYVPSQQLAVLDLGCGDGVLLQAVMDSFAVSHGIALDGSPAMLEKAEVRFQDLGLLSGLVEFVEADFNEPAWLDSLPIKQFDAIVSGFAIHHSEDSRKQSLYSEILDLLNPGGVFVNVEHVSSSALHGEEMFERAYAQALARYRKSIGQETDEDFVYEELQSRPDKAANRLVSVETQLNWLRQIGFRDVDCYWKHFELAVIAGYRRVEEGVFVSRRVLVVDDEMPIARLVQVNLQQAGYTVECAYDGRDALQKLDTFHPELLVLDVAMPYADGFEIIEIMKSNPDTKDLPVVFLTAKSNEVDIFRGYQSGADCYLTKPFEPADVIAIVDRIFSAKESDKDGAT